MLASRKKYIIVGVLSRELKKEKSMGYKIAFFDVDGTITNHKDGSISTKTKDAILALKDKGMKVVAATGRPLSMCQDIKSTIHR